MSREIERRAETLDLEGPRELGTDAVRDAAGRDDEEREEHDGDDTRERGETDDRLAPALPAPNVGRCERNQHGGIELHGDRSAEHTEPEAVAPVNEGGERTGDERCRPEIEAGEHHGAEQQRKARGKGERGHGPEPRCPEPRQRDSRQDHHGRPADRHQPLEEIPELLRVVAQQRRQHEHRQRPRWVLGPDVAIGHRPVLDRSAVALVHRGVDDLALVVPGRVQDPPADEEKRPPRRRLHAQ